MYKIGLFITPGIFATISALNPACWVALLRKMALASSKPCTCQIPCASRSSGALFISVLREVFWYDKALCSMGHCTEVSADACMESAFRVMDMEYLLPFLYDIGTLF